MKTNNEKEFDFLRIVEQKLRDSGIIEAVQSEVRNRTVLWGQNDEKDCWLTDCSMRICFNVQDQEQIATAEPFLMLNIGNMSGVEINMTVHPGIRTPNDTEYCTIYRDKEIVYDDKRKR